MDREVVLNPLADFLISLFCTNPEPYEKSTIESTIGVFAAAMDCRFDVVRVILINHQHFFLPAEVRQLVWGWLPSTAWGLPLPKCMNCGTWTLEQESFSQREWRKVLPVRCIICEASFAVSRPEGVTPVKENCLNGMYWWPFPPAELFLVY